MTFDIKYAEKKDWLQYLQQVIKIPWKPLLPTNQIFIFLGFYYFLIVQLTVFVVLGYSLKARLMEVYIQ